MVGLTNVEGSAEVNRAVIDEVLARTIGKFHQMFLKEYDGTPVPGVSYDISFTGTRPEGVEKGRLWHFQVGGAGPEGRRGAAHVKGDHTVYLHTSWLVRNVPDLSRGRVSPSIRESDLPYLRGEYGWGESLEGNERAGRIRSMVDAMAGAIVMRGGKELGLMIGLSLGGGEDIRSVMNVDGGAGVRETNVHFTERESRLLEKVLHRCP